MAATMAKNGQYMNTLVSILSRQSGVALLVGNGINRFANQNSSWEDLLATISRRLEIDLSQDELLEMSNTEFFDILDISRQSSDSTYLKQLFCDLMRHWMPGAHHSRLVGWAQRYASPIMTVNFDENLSRSVSTKFILTCGLAPPKVGFSSYYPWQSFFGPENVENPAEAFGIWHPHGMLRYSRSIRLGLRDYMGSVQRARSWIYHGENSLVRYFKQDKQSWRGFQTWLHPLFTCDIALVGFGFGKDETFLRWLFLERARLHKQFPLRARRAWFVTVDDARNRHREPFLTRLGIQMVELKSHQHIYESEAWDK